MKYSRLSIMEDAEKGIRGEHRVRCMCDCGKEITVRFSSLRGGNTKSCGCLNREIVSQMTVIRNTTHGLTHSRTYRIWAKMKERCENPKCKSFENYGGRGIIVCPQWSSDFEAFYRDMGACPAGHSIERKNNDGNYESSNCKWATKKEQANNTRTSRILEFNGERKTLAQWSQITGINYKTLQDRFFRGWSTEQVLTKPVRPML